MARVATDDQMSLVLRQPPGGERIADDVDEFVGCARSVSGREIEEPVGARPPPDLRLERLLACLHAMKPVVDVADDVGGRSVAPVDRVGDNPFERGGDGHARRLVPAPPRPVPLDDRYQARTDHLKHDTSGVSVGSAKHGKAVHESVALLGIFLVLKGSEQLVDRVHVDGAAPSPPTE